MANANNLHIVSHPLVAAKLSALRQTVTNHKDFREGIYDLSYILGVEASRDIPVTEFRGTSPIADFTGSKITESIALLPILRAGLPMSDALLRLFPEAKCFHLGLFREKVSLQPVEYYSKLPTTPDVDRVFLLDPLIATGGTICAALQMIVDWGFPISRVKLVVILASHDGLDIVLKQFPGLEIWVAAVDPVLTPQGIISPGLGDAGDRLNNTSQH